MKQQLPTPESETPPTNLADTLALGFGVFLRRFWIVLIPLLVDAWLFWGPNLYPQSFAESVQTALTSSQAWTGLTTQDVQQAQTQVAQADLRRYGVVFSVFSTLSLTTKAANQAQTAFFIDTDWLMWLIILGLNLGSLLLAAWMFQPLADRVAGRSGLGFKRSVRSFWVLLQVFGVLTLVMLIGVLPLLLSAIGLLAMSQLALQLSLGFVVLWGFVLWLVCSFSIEAVFVGQVSPIVAIYQSYHIVRSHLRAVMVLNIALWILIYGFGFLLQPMLTGFWETLGAIGIYAVLSGSLVAARMVFYQDRIARVKRTVPIFFAHE